MSVVCMCIRFTQFRSSLEADCCGQVMKSEHLFTGRLAFEFLRVLFCGIRNPYYIKKSRGGKLRNPIASCSFHGRSFFERLLYSIDLEIHSKIMIYLDKNAEEVMEKLK
jgi:hypothetical protein